MATESVLRVAAKAVIVNEKGEILFVREASTYQDGTHVGKYQIPGGRIDPGENFYDALHREVREETGLEIEPQYPIYVGEWNPVIKGVKHQIVAIFMVCKPKSTDVKLSDEHDDFKWVDPSNYAIQMTEPEPKVLEAFIKYGK